MAKSKIKVVAGIPIKDLPTKATMLYVLDGFYHKYGTDKTLEKIYNNMTKAELAVLYLKARRYM